MTSEQLQTLKTLSNHRLTDKQLEAIWEYVISEANENEPDEHI